MIKSNHSYLFFFIILLSFTIATSSCRTTKNTTTTVKENSSLKNKIQSKYATILGVEEESISNIKLYSFVDEWVGVPYKYGGKSKEGVDCSDFTVILCKNVYNKTIEVPASKIYSQCNPIELKDIKEGDLVFFKIEGNKISHVGVYLQNNKFIHASTKKGVIINDLNEAYYKKYFYKAARIK